MWWTISTPWMYKIQFNNVYFNDLNNHIIENDFFLNNKAHYLKYSYFNTYLYISKNPYYILI